MSFWWLETSDDRVEESSCSLKKCLVNCVDFKTVYGFTKRLKDTVQALLIF